MANGLLDELYTYRKLIEEQERRNPLFGLQREEPQPPQHQAVPAKTTAENLLQRVTNIYPRTMSHIAGGASLLGPAPDRSVVPKRGVPVPPFYDAGRTVLRNIAGLLGIAGAGVSGPVQALIEEPISKQLQLEANLSREHGDLAAMAATGLLPFAMGTKVRSLARGRAPSLAERMVAPDPEGDLRRKLSRKDEIGAPQQRIVLEANGDRMVVGDITFDDWAERVNSMNANDIADYRKWYKVASQEFRNVFGEKEGDKYLLGWLLGNQNESPAGALRNLLRAEEKYRGIHQPRTAGLGEEKIIQALGDDPITSGAAAKLFDFVDSAEGRRLRTFMGDNPRGGSPAVMDVHSSRDVGLVDETFHTWLKKKFGDQADQVKIDVKSGVSETQYERGSEKMNLFAEEANRVGFLGGDWTPAEIQAVGWKYMGDKVGGGVQTIPEAIQSNLRRISSELAFAVGSPLDQAFGQTFRNMPYNDQRWLTDHVYRSTLPGLMDAVGVRGVANMAGGKYGGVTPPSIQLDALASPERAADMADTIGFVFQQDEVIRARPLGGGDTVSLNVTLQGNPTFNQAMQFADGISQTLDMGTWGGRMMGPPTRKQGLLVPDVTAPGFYYMPETKTITFFLNRQPRITTTGKVSKVTEGTGALSNRIQSDIDRVLQTIGKKYNLRSNFKIFNSEAAWHGEEGHWAKGGRGEVYKRGLGERGRSDLQAGLDNSAQHVGQTTREGIQILESGNAPRYRQRPIKGPRQFSPIDEKTGLLAGFLMPK